MYRTSYDQHSSGGKSPGVIDVYMKHESEEHTGGDDSYTCPLALLFCVKTVLVAVTASIPELSTGIGLIVVVPADVVVTTCALVQNQITTRV